MTRCQDWPEKLDKYLRENDNKKFIYGEFDCVKFGAGIIKEMTNIDILDPSPPEHPSERRCRAGSRAGDPARAGGIEYKDKKTALRVLKDGGGLFKMTSRQMQKAGFEEIIPELTQRGDIVGFMNEAAGGEIIGICIGSLIITTGLEGLEYFPMTEAIIAWRIN